MASDFLYTWERRANSETEISATGRVLQNTLFAFHFYLKGFFAFLIVNISFIHLGNIHWVPNVCQELLQSLGTLSCKCMDFLPSWNLQWKVGDR